MKAMQVGHHEAASIWPVLDQDARVRVVVLTGEGAAFCAGGDMAMIERAMSDNAYLLQMHEEARALCHNMVNMSKVCLLQSAPCGMRGYWLRCDRRSSFPP
jgi:enoyl-CoA hydratase